MMMWMPIVISSYLLLMGSALPTAHEDDEIVERENTFYPLSQQVRKSDEPVVVNLSTETKRMADLKSLLRKKFNKKPKTIKKAFEDSKKNYNKKSPNVKIVPNEKTEILYDDYVPVMTKVRVFVNEGFPPQITAESVRTLDSGLQPPTRGFVPSLTIEVLSQPRTNYHQQQQQQPQQEPERNLVPPIHPFVPSLQRQLRPPTRPFVPSVIRQLVPPTRNSNRRGGSSSRIKKFI